MTTQPRILAPERVRHPLVMRPLSVLRAERISPGFVRVTLGGEALAGFVSASFDDHVKLMLPAPGQTTLVLPTPGPDGPVMPEGAARPTMRDYTPRRHDAAAGELDIELALHGEGPAAAWAAQAAAGQRVGVGGPRGSFVVPLGYDWHLLIGDETALPAIARRLEELPADAHAIVLIELADAADRRTLASRANVQVQWLAAEAAASAQGSALVQATQALHLPAGEGYAWAAGESQAIAAVRSVLVETHGLPKTHVRAAAYWKRGTQAHHENLTN